ncbi:MAG: hypothetical protein EAX87_10735 [Candidatus Thorarchaeota archaeon]|nr:hypothetical protein [Candidatus Thorarchaeota archaeon]
MSRAGASLCVEGFGKIVNILVAFVAVFWLLLKAIIQMDAWLLAPYDVPVSVLFTGFLILASAKVMEKKSTLFSIVMIAIGIIMQGVVIFYGLSSTSFINAAVLEPFFVAIYIYWSVILGHNIAKSSGISESSTPMERLPPFVLAVIGAVGLYINLPYLVSAYFVPSYPPYTIPVASLLTSLILIGASMMSLRSHSIYWILFFMGLGISIAPYFLPAVLSMPYYGLIWFVGDIMYKFFGVAAVAYVTPPPKYSG